MNVAKQIVAILLEDHRMCAGCQKEFGLTPPPGTSHGMCRRHAVEYYSDLFTPEQLAATPDEQFCPDMAQQHQQQPA